MFKVGDKVYSDNGYFRDAKILTITEIRNNYTNPHGVVLKCIIRLSDASEGDCGFYIADSFKKYKYRKEKLERILK
jgi:hypothetical protein